MCVDCIKIADELHERVRLRRKTWHQLIATCLRKRALQMVLIGEYAIAQRMSELAYIEETKYQ